MTLNVYKRFPLVVLCNKIYILYHSACVLSGATSTLAPLSTSRELKHCLSRWYEVIIADNDLAHKRWAINSVKQRSHFINTFRHNLNILEISFHYNSTSGNGTTINFAHFVACTKFCSDPYVLIWIKAKLGFHRIWNVMDKIADFILLTQSLLLAS